MTFQLIRGLSRWPDITDTVVTIGNFDGAHLGHQAMFEATIAAARQHQLPATVISFDPLPHEYFSPEKSPPRLQGLRDRVRSIAKAGIDRLLLLSFDKELAAQHADEFIAEVLVDKLRARHMVIGDDFRFGHKRLGTIESLYSAAETFGYSVQQSPTRSHAGSRISSTRIREHLTQGRLEEASSLLGRPYRISGRVIHGEKLGRQLGFPTANVGLSTHRPPLRGVFAVTALNEESGERFNAVANLGERPTLGGRKLLLEVHALDTSVQWYGQHLAVDFVSRLREEQRFNTIDELKTQIARDADAARELLVHR
ncbi:MAG: bifunctional riboflavin kinase/FAD synthetase [Granulosicoccus sp.]